MSSIVLPDEGTYSSIYGPAMTMTEQQEADDYFEALVDRHVRQFALPRDVAERDVRANLGYIAGYYSVETMQRVNRLFRTTHPVFGG